MAELLLEIGTEELPPPELPRLAHSFQELAAGALREHLLEFEALRVLYTPRRLALHVRGLPERQADREEEVLGPPVKVGMTPDGSYTQAAQGFARSQGVAVEELGTKTTEKGEYLYVRKLIPGRPTAEVLKEILPELIRNLPLPETMRWDGSGLRFIRPIRWLLCLLDGRVLEFRLGGLRAGNRTRLHRFHQPREATVNSPGEYFATLREDLVVLDPEERRRAIVEELEAAAAEVGGRPLLDREFLDFLTAFVEHPAAVRGGFEERFLELPQEIIFTTMREEGHFVPVVDGSGKALPHFIGLRDGPNEPAELAGIRRGYERILRAKLTDSEYFFRLDRQRRLADYLPKLKEVIYQEDLGTIWDKVERIRTLAAEIASRLGFRHREEIDRTARLCKADLVTQMVQEFPSLEGVIGGIYAALDGEPELVARGIREHYLPRSREDALPESEPGIAVSLADKLDTVIGSLLLGEVPTGSRDPFGLRRKANGVIRIALGRGLDLDFYRLIRDSEGLYGFLEGKRGNIETVIEFLNGRLHQILLQEHGFDYDIVDATTSVGDGNFWLVYRKSQALSAIRGGEEFTALVLAFTRARNIVARAPEAPEGFNPELFEEEAEHELWQAYLQAQERIAGLEREQRYDAILQELLRLKGPIDRYFDEVLVMADSAEVRANRLGFLRSLVGLFFRIGDLSKLVVPKGQGGR